MIYLFQVDRIVDQFIHYITNYDLANLRDYWTYLDRRLFSRLEQCYSSTIRKLEVSLLRYYLVNAIQNSRQDKVVDFFKEMTAELQNQPEWKDWFGKNSVLFVGLTAFSAKPIRRFCLHVYFPWSKKSLVPYNNIVFPKLLHWSQTKKSKLYCIIVASWDENWSLRYLNKDQCS